MRRALAALALSLWAGASAAGSITVELTPDEFRDHRIERGTALSPREIRNNSNGQSGVTVSQTGDNNSALVDTNASNSAVIVQRGDDHSASVTQTGSGQGALVIQTGTGAATDITQTTDGEKVVILQHSWEPRR